MAGRKKSPGLRWHTVKGWYRVYDGKQKYFGGSGSREESEARKSDESIQRDAEKRWHEHEADHLFGATVATVDRSAGRLKGFADAAHLIVDQVQVGALSDDQRNQLAERLRIGAIQFFNEIATQTETILGPIKQPTAPTNGGATCKLVVDAYLAYLKAEADRDPETKRAHYIDAKSRLKHWLKFIGDTPLSALTKNHFLRYRDMLNGEAGKRQVWLKKQPQNVPFKELLKAPGISQSVVNKYFVLVKGSFTAARREADIVVSGIDDMLSVLRQSKANKRELPLITPEHFKTMQSELDEKFALMCLIAMNIAGSNADIARLKWTHIRDDGVFDWSRDKNTRIRRTPLWKRTLTALKEYRQKSKSEVYVFTTTHGNPYQHASENSRKDQIGQQWGYKMTDLDLPYSFGAIRKTATTIALIAGANETVIKMLLGVAGDEVWRHYGMTVPDIVAKAVKSVEKHYFGKK